MDKKIYDKLLEVINKCAPEGDKIIATIPSKIGYHVITKPFRVDEFRKIYSHNIHKDSPTNLYIP